MRPTMRCHGTNREAHHSALLSVDRRYHWLIANRSIQARSRRDKKNEYAVILCPCGGIAGETGAGGTRSAHKLLRCMSLSWRFEAVTWAQILPIYSNINIRMSAVHLLSQNHEYATACSLVAF